MLTNGDIYSGSLDIAKAAKPMADTLRRQSNLDIRKVRDLGLQSDLVLGEIRCGTVDSNAYSLHGGRMSESLYGCNCNSPYARLEECSVRVAE